MNIDHGPAVHDRCHGHENPEFDYPARFEDRVPKLVKMTTSAWTDIFATSSLGREHSAKSVEIYPA